MARSTSYNTRTRQLILDYLTANRRHAVSAADIVAHLEAEGERTNPTTVYRYLDKLAGEHRVMKYVAGKGERAVYQYADEAHHCHEHIHLKCTCCGEIFHMDCHFMDEVRQHLLAEPNTASPSSARAASCTACAGSAPKNSGRRKTPLPANRNQNRPQGRSPRAAVVV